MSSPHNIEPARVISADPAWRFEDKLPGGGRGADKHYDTMSIEDVVRYPLPPIAENALLFLWCVASMKREAYEVVRAWGFKEKTEIVWVKSKESEPADEGETQMGMGHYVRNVHETCIVATRGKVHVMDKAVRSVFFAPRTEHSAKPDEFYKLVERLAGTDKGPLVELFGRKARPGWHVYGHEAPGELVPVGGILTKYVYTQRAPNETSNPKAAVCKDCGAEYFGPDHVQCPKRQQPEDGEYVPVGDGVIKKFALKTEEKVYVSVPSTAGSSVVDGVQHGAILVPKSIKRSGGIFSEAQMTAWVKRGLSDGIILEIELDDDLAVNYQKLIDAAPASWVGWSEESIVEEKVEEDVTAQPATSVEKKAVPGTVTTYECSSCGLVQSRGQIEKHQGCCMACGSDMSQSTPVAEEPGTKFVRTEVVGDVSKAELAGSDRILASQNQPDVMPHIENISVLTDLLAKKRAIVDLATVAGWSPDDRKKALAWALGEVKARPAFIQVKKGRISKEERALIASGTTKNGSPSAASDPWAISAEACERGDDPNHPSFYWTNETSEEEKRADLVAWRAKKSEGEISEEEKRMLKRIAERG